MIRILTALFGVLLLTGGAVACDAYTTLSTGEMKDYRDKLGEAGADPLDQLFAYEQLACSDNPTIRAYAIKTGLETATEPLVRQQIMFDAMMAKTRLDIELTANAQSTARDKDFIKENSGLWTLHTTTRYKAEGCINLLGNAEQCYPDYVLYVRGPKVELTYSSAIGMFELADSNELVGFVRYYDNDSYSRIPAVIKLF